MAYSRKDDRDRNVRPISLTRRDSVNISGVSPLEQGSPGDGSFPVEMALSQAQGPWKRDRATLTLEAQVLLLEMRSAGKSVLGFAGQMYSNVISRLKVAAGRVLKLEPFGGYRLVWQNQAQQL